MLLNQARAHFKNQINTRNWNAQYGGVYVYPKEGQKPNPYLQNNTLKDEHNNTLIKINPAWMTRQLSDLLSKDNLHHFNITSLDPINPKSQPNIFEAKAIKIFLEHNVSEYYESSQKELKFKYMGALIARPSCLACHPQYRLGKLRGGISVIINADKHYDSHSNIRRNQEWQKFVIVVVSILLLLLILRIFRYSQTLEKKIKKEVIKNRINDQKLLAQSRAVQMEEMILKSAQDTSKYALHLSETIDDFRNFFSVDNVQKATTFDEIIHNVFQLISESLEGHNITIKQELSYHEVFLAYSNELKHVVLNLLKNAQDAFIENSIKSREIRIKTYLEKDQKVLEIRDNAGGIPEKIIEQIFDPYFSTKTKQNGIGLGLYMSKMIVQKHLNGKLKVESQEGQTTFKIIL
ncbi:MAG: ATP-binding protein [Campylobacterota bacterium]|nr:ATP-binding protein [Campylobacterota bacterium]